MHLGLEPAAQRDQLAAVAHRLPQTTHVGRGDPRLGQPAHPEQVSKITSVKFVVLHPPVRETLNPKGCAKCTVAPASASTSAAQYQPYVASSTTSGRSPHEATSRASSNGSL